MILIRGNVEKEATAHRDIEKLKNEGFKEVLPAKYEGDKPDTAEKKAIEDMNLKELKKYAEEKGISGATSLSKGQLLEVLKEMV